MTERILRVPQGTRSNREFQRGSGQATSTPLGLDRFAIIGDLEDGGGIICDLSPGCKIPNNPSIRADKLPRNSGFSKRQVSVRPKVKKGSYEECARNLGISYGETRCIDLNGYAPVPVSGVELPVGVASVTLFLEFGSEANYLVCKVYKSEFENLFWREVCLLRQLINCVGGGTLVRVDENKLTLYLTFCGPSTEKIAAGDLNSVLKKQTRILAYRESLIGKSCPTDNGCPKKKPENDCYGIGRFSQTCLPKNCRTC